MLWLTAVCPVAHVFSTVVLLCTVLFDPSAWCLLALLLCCFFFNDTATTEIYTLSLHDALPIFIPKLRLILILNSFLGSSDSLVFSELFHSLAPRPLAARSISDFLLTYLAT